MEASALWVSNDVTPPAATFITAEIPSIFAFPGVVGAFETFGNAY